MFELLVSVLTQILFGPTILYLLLGVSLGLLVGVMPGLGTTAGMALMVPFVYGMDMMDGLALLIGLLAVVPTGDTVTSVLVGIPGSGSSQATVLDGFPMAKRGEAGRALSAAYSSSLIGGLFGALILTAAIFVARPVILAFGVGELLLLALLGITMVSVLAGASLVKGFVAAGLGMILGSIGGSPATGQLRMTDLEPNYLFDGIPLAVIALSLFAIPEIIDLLRRGTSIADRPPIGGGWMRGLLDTWKNRWLVFRCACIGCIIGALPIGSADWFAYGHGVQSSRNKENFGKGDVRGVIAPESANNANLGGALVPTLMFGIPGSSSTAVFLGGLVLLGVRPGPMMIESQLDLTYTIIWSLALANVIGAGVCFFLSGQMAKLTSIRFVYVAPVLIAVIFFGAYQATRQWGDLIALCALGGLGIYMKRFGYARPAFVIGFVLQDHIELLLYQAVQIYSLIELVSRPLFIVLLVLIALSLYFGLRHRPVIEVEGRSAMMTPRQRLPQIMFLAVIIATALYCLFEVQNISFLSKVFPMTVGILTLGFGMVALIAMLTGSEKSPVLFDLEVDWRSREEGHKVSLFHYMYWLGGLLALIALFGFVLGMASFFVLFLSFESNAKWWTIGIMTAAVMTAYALLQHFLVLTFPLGLLQHLVSLPPPFN